LPNFNRPTQTLSLRIRKELQRRWMMMLLLLERSSKKAFSGILQLLRSEVEWSFSRNLKVLEKRHFFPLSRETFQDLKNLR
jgi:hypothetical protein